MISIIIVKKMCGGKVENNIVLDLKKVLEVGYEDFFKIKLVQEWLWRSENIIQTIMNNHSPEKVFCYIYKDVEDALNVLKKVIKELNVVGARYFDDKKEV